MKTSGWIFLLACVLASGCKRSGDGDGANVPAPGAPPSAGGLFGNPDASERVWVGLLPCSDCQGIDTRLVLRSEGGRHDYLITETYVGGVGKNSFNRAGTWRESVQTVAGETSTLYELDPGQGGDRYLLQPDGSLELVDGDGKLPAAALAYRLQRL